MPAPSSSRIRPPFRSTQAAAKTKLAEGPSDRGAGLRSDLNVLPHRGGGAGHRAVSAEEKRIQLLPAWLWSTAC